MAILLPMLVLLMIGILEFGGAFKDFLTTSSAVREGTRALSALGDDEFADCVALAKALEGTAGVLSGASGWHHGYLFSMALTIGGGTGEVQRNILGERVLGLPAEPGG